jgi:hypothetical protein
MAGISRFWELGKQTDIHGNDVGAIERGEVNARVFRVLEPEWAT